MQVLANRTTEAQNWVTALMDNMDHGLFTGLLNQSNNFVNLIYSSSFNPNKQAITAYSNTLKNHVKSYHRPSTTSSSITLEPCVVQTCPKLKKKIHFYFELHTTAPSVAESLTTIATRLHSQHQTHTTPGSYG